MAYTKQTWNTGDIITAEKLNHIEDGISNAGGLLIVPAHYGESNDIVLEKTWSEINSHVRAGGLAVMRQIIDDDEVVTIGIVGEVSEDGTYKVTFLVDGVGQNYFAQNENDYPTHPLD